jgi:hypothetical protein
MDKKLTCRMLSLSAALLCASTANATTAPAAACSDQSRACLDSIARLYIGALVSHDGSGLPLADNARRTENGLVNANGADELRESFVHTQMVRRARGIRLITDEQKGEVVAFYLLEIVLDKEPSGETQAGGSTYKNAVNVPAGSYTVLEAERFKVKSGRLVEVEVIGHVENGLSGRSGWPD